MFTTVGRHLWSPTFCLHSEWLFSLCTHILPRLTSVSVKRWNYVGSGFKLVHQECLFKRLSSASGFFRSPHCYDPLSFVALTTARSPCPGRCLSQALHRDSCSALTAAERWARAVGHTLQGKEPMADLQTAANRRKEKFHPALFWQQLWPWKV